MEELIQVGRFILREREGYEAERKRVQAQIRPKRSHKREPKFPFHVCENPDEEFGRCRAMTGSWGEPTRCSRGRSIFNMFCGSHDKMLRRKYSEQRVKAFKPIKEIFDHIGFKGQAIRFGDHYQFMFMIDADVLEELEQRATEEEIGLVGTPFRVVTTFERVDSATIYEWVEAAMRAHEYAHLRLRCVHCMREFRQVDGTGYLCKCHAPVCYKCYDKHHKSVEHDKRTYLDLGIRALAEFGGRNATG